MITIKDGAELRLPAGQYRFTKDSRGRIRIERVCVCDVVLGDSDAEQEPVLQREKTEGER